MSSHPSRLLPAWGAGALAGLLAAIPMSMVMLALHRRLPKSEQYPLPAFNILPPATRAPVRRNALMIASHLVWGAAIAGVVSMLGGRRAH